MGASSGHTHAGTTASGALYIYERNAGGPNNWGEVKELIATDLSTGGNLGVATAISGDTVIGSNVDYNDFRQPGAYVFERNAGGPNNWGDPGTGVGNEVKKLVPSDVVPQGAVRNPSGDAACGLRGSNSNYIVSIDGDVVVYGACQHFHAGFGTAFVFERDAGRAGNWGETQELIPSDGGDAFGTPAVDGSTIIIGDLSDNILGSDSGAVYIFERPSDTTPPIIVPTVTGTLGNNGWYVSDIDVSWTVTDPDSPVTTSGCDPQLVDTVPPASRSPAMRPPMAARRRKASPSNATPPLPSSHR